MHRFGSLRGLNEKNPAEKMCCPCCLDLRCSEEELAAEATAQEGSLLLSNFTVHALIFLTCLLTDKGSSILNFPCSSVFTSVQNLGFELFPSLHSTATDAPAHKDT